MTVKAALGYAARGWPVFPCDPDTKRPLVGAAPGEPKGSGGLKRATVSPEVIAQWWKKFPKAMIGVPTGPAIAALVVDVDAGADEKTGEVFDADDLVARLEAELGVQLPPTLAVATPRGGRHLYFQFPAGVELGNRAGIIPRVDVRGDGGYVIVPPSTRSDGRKYQFIVQQIKPAIAPEALLDLILRRGRWSRTSESTSETPSINRPKSASKPRPPAATDKGDPARRYALQALDAESERVRHAPAGTRSGALNEAAFNLGQLVAAGVLVESVVRASLEAASIDNGHVAKDGSTPRAPPSAPASAPARRSHAT
jgi:putative DNA primase/helicase